MRSISPRLRSTRRQPQAAIRGRSGPRSRPRDCRTPPVVATTVPAAMAQQRSVWSGVYTTAQAKRGETLYSGACRQCHGARLNGAADADQPPSPAIARTAFLRKWAGKPVAELFTFV